MIGLRKLSFKQKKELFIRIFEIPVKENWKEYLQPDYLNYFDYLNNVLYDKGSENRQIYSDHLKIADDKYLNRFLRKSDYYYKTKKLHNRIVADVGCGFGYLAVWYALSGAKKVFAIGYPFQTEFINELTARAKKLNITDHSFQLEAIAHPLESGEATIGGLTPESVDFVFYNEVFEHLEEKLFLDALKATYNTLNENGELISLTHNSDNPQVLDGLKKWWTKLEVESCRNYRKIKIKEEVPEINEADLERLVTATRGLLSNEFSKSIQDYKVSGAIKMPERLLPAVDLKFDYICENYISPPHVLNMMRSCGFKASCYAGLMHSRRKMFFQPLARRFNQLFISLKKFSGTVIFAGTKKA